MPKTPPYPGFRSAKRSCTTTLSWDTASKLEKEEMKGMLGMRLMVYLQLSDSNSGRRVSSSNSSLGET